MAFIGYLTNLEINDLRLAALNSNLIAAPRAQLLTGIPPGFAAALPLAANALDQFVSDLVEINRVERMAGGQVPVVIFLQNAVARLRILESEETGLFEQVLSRIGNLAAGVPMLPEPAELPEVISKERIFGTDDTLDLGFFDGGLDVARAVALIAVARFDNGVQTVVGGGPWVSKGTAWLLAPNLAITNHHVINARRDDEADASDADFRLQAGAANLRFDVDAPGATGASVKANRLVVASKTLDYALLELTTPVARPIPRLLPSIVELNPTSRIAVNIVQHPRGEHKQVAFRNNLVSAADAKTVRYFTDTDHGSSGSPVCADDWQVVALHRGARYTSGVQFQGKDEAFVNFGSQIQAVLADIRVNDPAVAGAIDAAQVKH